MMGVKRSADRRRCVSGLAAIGNELRRNALLYGMTVPTLVWVFVFCYIPLPGILIAFEKFSFSKGIWGSPFVGLDNFKFLFNYKNIDRVFFNTIFLNLLFITFGTLMAVLLALMFVEIRHKAYNRVTQTIAIFPHFISWTVVSMILTILLGSNGSIAKLVTGATGNNVQFYRDPSYWPLILVLVKIWQGAGYGSIVYVAAITGFDQQMYEAARVDGATKLQQAMRITLPLLRPTIVMLTIMSMGSIFRGDFGMIYAIVRDNSFLYPTADVIDTFVYRALRELNNLGMSTATSFFQSVVGLIMILATNFLARKLDAESAIF